MAWALSLKAGTRLPAAAWAHPKCFKNSAPHRDLMDTQILMDTQYRAKQLSVITNLANFH